MEKFNFLQPFIAVGAIIVKDNKLLMVKEAAGPSRGRWSLPAGRWDHRESLIDGIKREVLEETGYEFEPEYVLGVYSLIKPQEGGMLQVLRPIFVGSISGKQQPLAEDIDENAWVNIDELESVDYRSEDVKKMIEDFKKGEKYPLEILTHTEVK